MKELSREALSQSKISNQNDEEVEPSLKKEKSSESIIASFLQRNESLVKQDGQKVLDTEQAPESTEPKQEAGTPVVVPTDDVEGTPVVVEIPDAEKRCSVQELVDQPEPVREVAEAGTNMSISANAAALELQRIQEDMLE